MDDVDGGVEEDLTRAVGQVEVEVVMAEGMVTGFGAGVEVAGDAGGGGAA